MGQVSEAIEIAAVLCRKWEGLYLKPYICPAGYPTIGYGSTFYLNGSIVKMSDPPITKEMANELLLSNLVGFYKQTLVLCPGLVNESPQRVAAILDFVYNLGAGRLRASTLRRRINEGNWEEAKKELGKWVYGGGKVLRGLVLRRQDEINLI